MMPNKRQLISKFQYDVLGTHLEGLFLFDIHYGKSHFCLYSLGFKMNYEGG